MSTAKRLTVEQLQEAAKAQARKFARPMLEKGYKPGGLYEYSDANGHPLYWVIRLDHPKLEKWIRPEFIDAAGQWKMGRPTIDEMPLYRLPEIMSSSGPVFVVEGEKCADALAALGMIATTSGGASSAGSACWAPLRNRTVYIWPDNDEAGSKFANGVRLALKDITDDVHTLDAGALSLPEKGDCVDWLAHNPHADEARISALPKQPASYQDANTKDWPEPLPLRREPPPPEPFPLDALGEVLGGAAAELLRIIQAPDAVIGQSLLAAAALAVQAHADVTIDGRCSPLSLFFTTVAESGERKSAIDSEVLAPHNKREYDLIAQHSGDLLAYEADAAAYKKARDAITGNKKAGRDETRALLEDLGPPPPAPIRPHLTTGDPTVEGLIKALIHGWPTMGVFSSEGGRFLGGHAMSKENALKTSGGLSHLWDGIAPERTRGGDGVVKAYGKRASMHLLVQPGVASLLLGNPVVRDQGLLSRMLVAWPAGKTGHRPYIAENVKQTPGMQHYSARMMDWLDRDLPLAEGKLNELAPRELLLNHEAHADFVAFYNYVEKLMREGGALESTRGLGNKTPETAARIAGVLCLLSDPSATHIAPEFMNMGTTLMQYYLTEAIRLHEVAASNPELALAERCLSWIRSQGNRTSTPDLYQRGPNPVRDKDTANRILALLADHGLARPAGAGVVNGTKRTLVWEVRP